jgi:hypothetical protein
MQPILALAAAPPARPPEPVEEGGEAFDLVLGPEGAPTGRLAGDAAPALPVDAGLPAVPTVPAGPAAAATFLILPTGERAEAQAATGDRGASQPRPSADAPGLPNAETPAAVGRSDPQRPSRPVVADARLPVASVAAGPVSSSPIDMPEPGPAARPTLMPSQPAASPATPAIAPAARAVDPSRPSARLPSGRTGDAPAGPMAAGPDANGTEPAISLSATVRGLPAVAEGARDRQAGTLADRATSPLDRSAAAAPRLPDPAPPQLLSLTAAPVPAASAAAASVVAPAPMPPAGVPLSHLPAAVVSALAGGEGIVIDLSPADLGRMRIELPAAPGGVEVRLVVEQADTLPLVMKAAETLAEDLRQAGILAQSVTVELLAVDRADPARAEAPRADPGSASSGSGAAGAGGPGAQDRPGGASADAGSGAYRGAGRGLPDDDAALAAADRPPATLPERLDLRL